MECLLSDLKPGMRFMPVDPELTRPEREWTVRYGGTIIEINSTRLRFRKPSGHLSYYDFRNPPGNLRVRTY